MFFTVKSHVKANEKTFNICYTNSWSQEFSAKLAKWSRQIAGIAYFNIPVTHYSV